jgi:hypothetical protein
MNAPARIPVLDAEPAGPDLTATWQARADAYEVAAEARTSRGAAFLWWALTVAIALLAAWAILRGLTGLAATLAQIEAGRARW